MKLKTMGLVTILVTFLFLYIADELKIPISYQLFAGTFGYIGGFILIILNNFTKFDD